MKMAVIDLKSGNQQSHPLTSEGFSLGQSNLARDVENMCIHVRRHIDPMIEGFARHDQGVTVSDRSQCHEYDAVVVLQREVPWKFAVDDA